MSRGISQSPIYGGMHVEAVCLISCKVAAKHTNSRTCPHMDGVIGQIDSDHCRKSYRRFDVLLGEQVHFHPERKTGGLIEMCDGRVAFGSGGIKAILNTFISNWSASGDLLLLESAPLKQGARYLGGTKHTLKYVPQSGGDIELTIKERPDPNASGYFTAEVEGQNGLAIFDVDLMDKTYRQIRSLAINPS